MLWRELGGEIEDSSVTRKPISTRIEPGSVKEVEKAGRITIKAPFKKRFFGNEKLAISTDLNTAETYEEINLNVTLSKLPNLRGYILGLIVGLMTLGPFIWGFIYAVSKNSDAVAVFVPLSVSVVAFGILFWMLLVFGVDADIHTDHKRYEEIRPVFHQFMNRVYKDAQIT